MKYLFLILILSLLSCQDVNKMEKPDDLIPKDKMADVLLEMALLQGAKSADRRAFEETGLKPESYIWERFDIDSLQFVESSNYYAENYSEYQKIYLEVQQRLEVLQVTYDSLREIEQKKEDSIKALDPQDSIERAREEEFRDSILRQPVDERTLLPDPVSSEDTIR